MTGYSVTRRIDFCAGHRVKGHESKCANLHGHNYSVFITASAPELDSVGRVVDFSVLKETIGAWIDSHFDHGFILHTDDALAIELVSGFSTENLKKQKLFLLPYNPTAENIARYICEVVAPDLLEGYPEITVTKVVVQETPNCAAEWAI